MRYKLDHKSPVPLHAQVEDLIRIMSKDPEYRYGKFLPNEIDLAKKLGISRNTLRQAMNKLVYEGVLVRKKGIGTKFAEKSVDTHIRSWLSFSQEMEAKGIKIKNFEIGTEWIESNKDLSAFFGIPEKTLLLKMVRLRGREEGPIVYFESYFHPRIGLTGKEDYSRPLYEILEEDYSIIVKVSKEEISAIAADAFLSKKLNVKKGDPVLKRKRMVFAPGERPVEYNFG